jgi:hypothetical protein
MAMGTGSRSDASPGKGSEEPLASPGVEPGRKQSIAGIISCGLFGLVLVLIFVFRVIRPGEDITGPAASTVRLLQAIAVRLSFYAVMLGMVFGLLGIAQRQRKRHLAVVGLVLNALPFLLMFVQTARRIGGF